MPQYIIYNFIIFNMHFACTFTKEVIQTNRTFRMQKADIIIFFFSVILKKAFSKDDVRTVNITWLLKQWNRIYICT